ncbi:unnamed protein product [Sphagnum balticum]
MFGAPTTENRARHRSIWELRPLRGWRCGRAVAGRCPQLLDRERKYGAVATECSSSFPSFNRAVRLVSRRDHATASTDCPSFQLDAGNEQYSIGSSPGAGRRTRSALQASNPTADRGEWTSSLLCRQSRRLRGA